MNHQNYKCCKCECTLHYQVPTHLTLRMIGLKAYWCHKCDVNTYIWPWSVNVDKPIGQNSQFNNK